MCQTRIRTQIPHHTCSQLHSVSASLRAMCSDLSSEGATAHPPQRTPTGLGSRCRRPEAHMKETELFQSVTGYIQTGSVLSDLQCDVSQGACSARQSTEFTESLSSLCFPAGSGAPDTCISVCSALSPGLSRRQRYVSNKSISISVSGLQVGPQTLLPGNAVEAVEAGTHGPGVHRYLWGLC